MILHLTEPTEKIARAAWTSAAEAAMIAFHIRALMARAEYARERELFRPWIDLGGEA